MNIFFVNESSQLAAQDLCDKHVVKMVIESAQMLSAAHHINNPGAHYLPDLYKCAFEHHPCTKWVRESNRHYAWLLSHTFSLLSEFTFRYHKVHSTQRLMRLLEHNPCEHNGWVDPPQCMPDQYKDPNNTVRAYRNYYVYEKWYMMEWRYTDTPKWVRDELLNWRKAA